MRLPEGLDALGAPFIDGQGRFPRPEIRSVNRLAVASRATWPWLAHSDELLTAHGVKWRVRVARAVLPRPGPVVAGR